MPTQRRPASVTVKDLAALSPEEAQAYDRESPMSVPDTELEEPATVPQQPIARASIAPMPMADAIMEAVRQKLPAAELERLFALAERAADRQAKQDFNAALAAFQAVCPQIHKAKTVDFASSKGGRVHYTYAPLEVIAKAIAPAFSTAVTPKGMEVTCHVRHAGGHSESATFPLPIMEGTGSMSESQKNGGTLTFGMRNALRMALGLSSTDEDTDARDPEEDEQIGDGERQEIETAIAELRGDINRFCTLLGVERVGDMPRSKLKQARDLIARKRAEVTKNGGAA
jgi:hypothetical protein